MSLDTKAKIKKARPTFLRSNAKHVKRISRSGYRKPKGLQNKMGDNKKGRRSTIKTGFGYPKKVRGTNTQGLTLVNVTGVGALAAYDPKTHALIVSASLGLVKKIEVLKAAAEKGFTIQGIKDIKAKVAEIEKKYADTKKAAVEKKSTRKEKQTAAAKAAAGKEDKKKKDAKSDSKESSADSKEKKAEEKKELDKVLTQKSE